MSLKNKIKKKKKRKTNNWIVWIDNTQGKFSVKKNRKFFILIFLFKTHKQSKQ